ncbi:MAG: hypothetical protein LBT40_16820 [Deltaproteobacteria bacterium]|jgi:hypothetical protein|nr:hypothetical protein [Deltaproteobacteria bacterium]
MSKKDPPKQDPPKQKPGQDTDGQSPKGLARWTTHCRLYWTAARAAAGDMTLWNVIGLAPTPSRNAVAPAARGADLP